MQLLPKLAVIVCLAGALSLSSVVQAQPGSKISVQPARASDTLVAQKRISISNVLDQEERHYSVILLKGTADGARSITITNLENPGLNGTVTAPVLQERFKILVQLTPGLNHLLLKTASAEQPISVRYTPSTNDHLVNVVYLTADDDDTNYLTQKQDDPQNYRDKLDTAAKLMQCFTAERMHDAGKGYKTFNLDLHINADLHTNGRVKIKELTFPEAKDDLRRQSGHALFDKINAWLTPQYPGSKYKNMVVMAFTGYDNIHKKPLAHTASGAGNMGLFSCNGMCAWPNNLNDVVPAFTNINQVNDNLIWDDTNYRSRLWALASTTIGAMLHELGHTFELEHQMADPLSIMSRGFDYFDREFILQEPPALGDRNYLQVTDANTAHWDSESADKLSESPWFQ